MASPRDTSSLWAETGTVHWVSDSTHLALHLASVVSRRLEAECRMSLALETRGKSLSWTVVWRLFQALVLLGLSWRWAEYSEEALLWIRMGKCS